MISRKSAKLIADAFGAHFKSNTSVRGVYYLKDEEVNNFLYEHEYDLGFLQLMRGVVYHGTDVKLKRTIMDLHTGESMLKATPDRTWEQRRELGQILLKKLAEDFIKFYEPRRAMMAKHSSSSGKWDLVIEAANNMAHPALVIIDKLTSSLELDGYLYRDGHLYPNESSIVDVLEERTALEVLVSSIALRDLAVIRHHIHESERAYEEGRWGHSITDARNFLEAILQQLADDHHKRTKGIGLPKSTYVKAVLVREYLEAVELLDKIEQEALAKIYGLISNTGVHPNIAQKDQARLMRHLALTFSQFVLLKYQGYIKNHP